MIAPSACSIGTIARTRARVKARAALREYVRPGVRRGNRIGGRIVFTWPAVDLDGIMWSLMKRSKPLAALIVLLLLGLLAWQGRIEGTRRFAVSAEDGRVRWSAALDSDLTLAGVPAARGGRVVVGRAMNAGDRGGRGPTETGAVPWR
jgi:hypothetical protein